MQPDARVLYLLGQQLESAIDEAEAALARRRIQPTGKRSPLIGAEQVYYTETASLWAVKQTLDKLIEE